MSINTSLEDCLKFHTFCPRCALEFTAEHHSTGSLSCACGWIDTTNTEKASLVIEKKTIHVLLAFGAIFTAGLLHVGSWGNYALSIPFTKVAQVTGMLSADGYRDLAKTCIILNKWSCAEEAYTSLATQRGVADGFAELGSLEARLNKSADAVRAYASYEKNGGHESKALLQFGKLLESANQDAEATRIYEKSIASNPMALPIQATTGIVRLMMKQGKYVEAYERIVAFHESAENAGGYLNTEAAQLQKQLGETAAAKIEKKSSKRS